MFLSIPNSPLTPSVTSGAGRGVKRFPLSLNKNAHTITVIMI